MFRHFRLLLAGAAVALGVVVGLTSRNPNVIVAVAVIVAACLLALLGSYLVVRSRERAWSRALREARWEPVVENGVGDGTVVTVQRVARLGSRSTVLGRYEIDTVSATSTQDGSWEAAFAEAMGRAENRATVLNSVVRR